MKIPKYIEDAIRKTQKYSILASKYNNIVRDWLDKYNLVDTHKGNLDLYIDVLEEGQGSPDEIIEMIEQIDIDKIDFYLNNRDYD